MQCTCGGMITAESHEIKTEKKAIEWIGESIDKEEDLPLNVEKYNCNGCTRFAYIITNKKDIVLKRFNI